MAGPMKLTRLTLENFRSVSRPQTIEFAPVTLLFGPNSVGKSSVLMSLAYVLQIIEDGECDPKFLKALGGKHIDGFRSLVNGQDLNKSIRLTLSFRTGESEQLVRFRRDLYGYAGEALAENVAGAVSPGPEFSHFSVMLEIAWSDNRQCAFVREYSLYAEDDLLGTIRTDAGDSETYISAFNTSHPALSVFSELNSLAVPASITRSRFGALPPLNEMLEVCSSGMPDINVEQQLRKDLLLTETFVAPLKSILGYLKNSVFIGPLRIVPTVDEAANPYPSQGEWADGTAAWGLLHRELNANPEIKTALENVSDFLSSETGMNSGYGLVQRRLIDCFPDGQVPASLNISERGRLNYPELYFHDQFSDIDLSPNQVGTGMSQILPVLFAACYIRNGIVSVEQPELHIHPGFQIALGDLLVNQSRDENSPLFLIETHSEHLMLRLLRRVREEDNPVQPDDISVVCLTRRGSEVTAERVRVTEDGDFDHDWPEGFFEERDSELF